MPEKWNADGIFHLGINMAGAVSAGAYTAGALDFLIQALEQWELAKQAPHPQVPLHNITIDVFSGASAGGMCAAIAAVMVQSQFDHIDNSMPAPVAGTNNKLYESWVNRIDIQPLLQTNDLASGASFVSLLDSTIIDEIASDALTPGVPLARPYISPSLTLFLTLTNLRGTPFSLNGAFAGSAEEDFAYYADRLQFETVSKEEATPRFPAALPLPTGSTAGAWPLLKEAAKATGAFPLFLAPRKLARQAGDYYYCPWSSLAASPVLFAPHWPLHPGDTVETLNVDGGVTNNDPFQLAHDFLAIQNPLARPNPQTGVLENPPEPDTANCAVLTIAPFTASSLFDPAFNGDAGSTIFRILPSLLSALLGQSRFLGESLTALVSGRYSRFVLAPSDDANPNQSALQCGLLGAFGGFFERGFRAHDYQLGRRNCQQFLRRHFCLSQNNPIIAAGLDKLAPQDREAVLQLFDTGQPGTLPIIPLCGTAVPDVPPPQPATISLARLNQIVNWAVHRLQAVAKPAIEALLGPGVKSLTARLAVSALIATWGKAKIEKILTAQLANQTSERRNSTRS